MTSQLLWGRPESQLHLSVAGYHMPSFRGIWDGTLEPLWLFEQFQPRCPQRREDLQGVPCHWRAPRPEGSQLKKQRPGRTWPWRTRPARRRVPSSVRLAFAIRRDKGRRRRRQSATPLPTTRVEAGPAPSATFRHWRTDPAEQQEGMARQRPGVRSKWASAKGRRRWVIEPWDASGLCRACCMCF